MKLMKPLVSLTNFCLLFFCSSLCVQGYWIGWMTKIYLHTTNQHEFILIVSQNHHWQIRLLINKLNWFFAGRTRTHTTFKLKLTNGSFPKAKIITNKCNRIVYLNAFSKNLKLNWVLIRLHFPLNNLIVVNCPSVNTWR